MDLLGYIRENKSLNSLLSRECDIYFYHQTQEIQFSKNHEIYSLACQAFAQDGSGSEYVFLEDGSIGFIGSEGEVGRIAESLDELLTFLIHAGCISDFSCRPLYEKEELLKMYCSRYVAKMREDYRKQKKDWDEIRGAIAKQLSLPFSPNQFVDFAKKFYQSASREPLFSCRYPDGETEYVCDSVLSEHVGMWIEKWLGMSEEEMKKIDGINR